MEMGFTMASTNKQVPISGFNIFREHFWLWHPGQVTLSIGTLNLIRRHQHRGCPVVIGQHANSNSVFQHCRATFFDCVLFAEDHFAWKPQWVVHGRRRTCVTGLVDCYDRGLPGLVGHQSFHRIHLNSSTNKLYKYL